eukprot:s3464_g7.t1
MTFQVFLCQPLKLQNNLGAEAKASVQADADAIKERIQKEHQSFEYVNQTVEQALWCEVIKFLKQSQQEPEEIELSTETPQDLDLSTSSAPVSAPLSAEDSQPDEPRAEAPRPVEEECNVVQVTSQRLDSAADVVSANPGGDDSACETNHHQPHPRHGGQTVRRTFHYVRLLVNSRFNWVFFNSSCRAFRTFWYSLWREIPALPCRHYQWRRYRRLQCRQSWQLPMRRQQWVMELQTTKWHPKRWNRSCGTAPTPLEDGQEMLTGSSMCLWWRCGVSFLRGVPKLRCQSPRLMETASAWTTIGLLAHLGCSSALKQDDLSDGSSSVKSDGDGDLDVILRKSDELSLFEFKSGRHFVEVEPNPFHGIPGGRCRPAVVDWDGDGRLDLIVGAEDEAAKQV